MCLVCLINAEERRNRVGLRERSESFGSLVSLVQDDEGQEQHAIHYFAIGSMTNDVSLSLRELQPISSKPAVLRGHTLVFRGSGGMATVEEMSEDFAPCDEDGDLLRTPFVNETHGVLHLLSRKQMALLDQYEGGYNRKICTVNTYNDDTKVHAVCYVMDKSKWSNDVKHDLPSERYLDIIAQGCTMYNVDKEWVNFIRTRRCIPRKCPSEFQSFFSTSATVPILHWDVVQRKNGIDSDDLWIVINNKVLKFTGDATSFFPFGYFVNNGIGGTDFTLRFAKGFYEPKYKLSPSYTKASELQGEHRAWIEDQFANPPPVLSASTWEFIGVVTEVETFGVRKSKVLTCRPCKEVNFYDDMLSGYNHFFIDESVIESNGPENVWSVPSGIFIGQTLTVRKTCDFSNNVRIHIKNQDLSVPNVMADVFIFTTNFSFISWCWNGSTWFLEHLN